MRIHLNIGSNMGDRMAYIGRAVARLAQRFSPCKIYLSDYIETEPWGYDSPNKFLNRGVLILTNVDIAPLTILDITQSIEKEIGGGIPHRQPDGSYCDRLVDIDIIKIDNLHISTSRLTLPHPRAHLRTFVTIPMEYLDKHYPPLNSSTIQTS